MTSIGPQALDVFAWNWPPAPTPSGTVTVSMAGALCIKVGPELNYETYEFRRCKFLPRVYAATWPRVLERIAGAAREETPAAGCLKRGRGLERVPSSLPKLEAAEWVAR